MGTISILRNDQSPPKAGSRPPRLRPNRERRPREHLTYEEVERMIQSVPDGRTKQRNQLMIFLAFMHGFRAGELCNLEWNQIDLNKKTLYVRRIKQGNDSTHPLYPLEIERLKVWKAYQAAHTPRRIRRRGKNRDAWLGAGQPARDYVFTWAGLNVTTAAFHKIVKLAGQRANLGLSTHPHMLRHACGFYLANEGMDTRRIQDYLGHKSIVHTARYTALDQNKFVGMFKKLV